MAVHTIVLGTDGSAGSARAVAWVADLVKQLSDVTVVVAHAIGLLTHITPTPEPSGPHAEEILGLLRDDWSRPLQSTRAALRHEARPGNAVSVLLALADEIDADLVVVGTRGAGGFGGLTLGSTSQQLVQHSTVPVVVVPTQA